LENKSNNPSNDVFEEMKSACIAVFIHGNHHEDYLNEKLNIINNYQNINGDALMFYRMLDYKNQKLMLTKLSNKSLEYMKPLILTIF